MSVVAFDLGSSFCRVSTWWTGEEPKIIYSMPSIVSFQGNKVLFGEEAEDLSIENPTNTIYDIKRVLGMQFGGETEREKKELLLYQTIWPFSVETSTKGTYQIILKEKKVTIEEVTELILKHLKETCEMILKCEIENVVITIPSLILSFLN
jgi:molecular chaperone DnaK